jgi:hypothetical protein
MAIKLILILEVITGAKTRTRLNNNEFKLIFPKDYFKTAASKDKAKVEDIKSKANT